MDFTPQRMMRYIRSRARLATDEDIEDILQNALVLVTQHFDPAHPEAKLAPYCLGACNKAIAQNLERYHKVALRKRETSDAENGKDDEPEPANANVGRKTVKTAESVRAAEVDGTIMTVKTLSAGKSFDETPSTTSQYRTTSLDSMFDEDDSRTADDVLGFDSSLLAAGGAGRDPAGHALLNDLVERIMAELPTLMHRTCFVLKYVEGYKREDLIECLKMDAKSIDTIDKKIVRTLKAFKDKMDQEESRI